jgi:hypothetical protein
MKPIPFGEVLPAHAACGNPAQGKLKSRRGVAP